MESIDDKLNQRIVDIRNETKKQLQNIARNTLNLVARNKKQNVFEDLTERANELGKILDKSASRLTEHANKVIDDFEKEISNVQNKEVYIEKLKELLKEDCIESIHITKDKAIDRFKS